jgi:hypothetical protein
MAMIDPDAPLQQDFSRGPRRGWSWFWALIVIIIIIGFGWAYGGWWGSGSGNRAANPPPQTTGQGTSGPTHQAPNTPAPAGK